MRKTAVMAGSIWKINYPLFSTLYSYMQNLCEGTSLILDESYGVVKKLSCEDMMIQGANSW